MSFYWQGRMDKKKLEERKRMIAAAQQQHHSQQQQQQIIRVPLSSYPVQQTTAGHMRPTNLMGMQHQGQMRMGPGGASGGGGWADATGGAHPGSRMPMSSHVSTAVQPHAPQIMGGMQSQVVSGNSSSSPMISSTAISGGSVAAAAVNASQAGPGIMMTSPSISSSTVIGTGGAPGHKIITGAGGGGGVDTMTGAHTGMSGQHPMQTHAITSIHNSPMGAYMQPYNSHPSAASQQLTISGSNMHPGSANPNAPIAAMSATSPAVPLQSPSGGHAYSPHVVANPGSVNTMNNNMNNQQQSPAAPNSVEAVVSHPGPSGNSMGQHAVQQQQQQSHQNAASTQPQSHVISKALLVETQEQMAEKIRQQILKFTTSVARSQANFENNPNMWTPVIQKVYECGKGGPSRVAQLSNGELELYNKEIKMFYTRYNKYKAPQAPEKIVRAISDIMPMPSLNYNLNKVFDEPKRIVKGSLITCPAKKQRTDIEAYLVRDNNDDSFDQEREELKEQLQKEIAMSSEHFEIKFAMTTNYDSDPIVFNCFLKNERGITQCGVVQITVYSDYPDSSVDVRVIERDSISKQEEKASKQQSVLSLLDDYNEILSPVLRKRAQTFYSTLNSTQNCSFSHVLSKFVYFSKQTAEEL
ncbi:uncharacterized protein LOC142341754 isoform X2 [Convolutriloba macropyga]|uniref:uncharacterized protein LOC142341754 isoform X2 n=1 Tax=Convolutriloba macropyga TaxID=536237 RepID=UPI003F51FC94